MPTKLEEINPETITLECRNSEEIKPDLIILICRALISMVEGDNKLKYLKKFCFTCKHFFNTLTSASLPLNFPFTTTSTLFHNKAECLRKNLTILRLIETQRWQAEALGENIKKVLQYRNIRELQLLFKEPCNLTPLMKLLEENRNLTALNLANSKIISVRFYWEVALGKLLSVNKAIRVLNLKSTDIKAEGMKKLAKSLTKNDTLTELDLSKNSIKAEGAKSLVEFLTKLNTLTELDISSNSLFFNEQGDGAETLPQYLAESTTLQKLNLSHNDITAEGMKRLAESLTKNDTLTKLDLSQNYIKAEGAKSLVEFLTKLNTLTELDISSNSLFFNEQGDGAETLPQYLAESTTLQKLNLSHNDITAEGMKRLVVSLVENRTLTELDLSHNEPFLPGGTNAIADLLKKNATINTLNLSNIRHISDHLGTLAESLAENRTLTRLSLSHNQLTSSDARAIAKILSCSHSLKELDISNNNIEPEGAVAIADALVNNSSIKTLLIGNNKFDLKPVENCAKLFWKFLQSSWRYNFNDISAFSYFIRATCLIVYGDFIGIIAAHVLFLPMGCGMALTILASVGIAVAHCLNIVLFHVYITPFMDPSVVLDEWRKISKPMRSFIHHGSVVGFFSGFFCWVLSIVLWIEFLSPIIEFAPAILGVPLISILDMFTLVSAGAMIGGLIGASMYLGVQYWFDKKWNQALTQLGSRSRNDFDSADDSSIDPSPANI